MGEGRERGRKEEEKAGWGWREKGSVAGIASQILASAGRWQVKCLSER